MAEQEKYISKAPIRRLMKNQGANLVAEEAVITLVDFLEKFADGLTKKAMKIAEEDKRKKLTAEDILAALKAK
nr:NFYB/HAP3 family transcription factor subunit [Candidatus Sigynarchaeota archaeon]